MNTAFFAVDQRQKKRVQPCRRLKLPKVNDVFEILCMTAVLRKSFFYFIGILNLMEYEEIPISRDSCYDSSHALEKKYCHC